MAAEAERRGEARRAWDERHPSGWIDSLGCFGLGFTTLGALAVGSVVVVSKVFSKGAMTDMTMTLLVAIVVAGGVGGTWAMLAIGDKPWQWGLARVLRRVVGVGMLGIGLLVLPFVLGWGWSSVQGMSLHSIGIIIIVLLVMNLFKDQRRD